MTHIFDLSRSSTLWQPGERLPFNNVHVPETPSQLDGAQHREFESTSVVEVLQTLQSSLDGQLTQINSTLKQISERLDVLEERQESIENKIASGSSSSSLLSTPQSSSSESGPIRKRRTPIALQV